MNDSPARPPHSSRPRTHDEAAVTYRIVQWTTGNVGKRSVQAVVKNPELDLVGCYAWSKDKVGQDVGVLCGIEPLGISATDDVDSLLALAPDCVVYNPMWPDVDELVRILSCGINVVSTAAFITGHYLGEGRARIITACEQGGSTISVAASTRASHSSSGS
jgi:2,4-diaminopentanoate dehydrogenase